MDCSDECTFYSELSNSHTLYDVDIFENEQTCSNTDSNMNDTQQTTYTFDEDVNVNTDAYDTFDTFLCSQMCEEYTPPIYIFDTDIHSNTTSKLSYRISDYNTYLDKLYADITISVITNVYILDMNANINTNIHTCFKCDKTFKSSIEYDSHIAIHNTNGYVCCGCGKNYSSESNLKRHQRSACSVMKIYKCNECKRSFITSDALERHNRTHTTMYSCKVCAKVCASEFGLVSHMRAHR